LLNPDEDVISEEARSSGYSSFNSQSRFSQNISDRMIGQFFKDIIEGPDRNWDEEY